MVGHLTLEDKASITTEFITSINLIVGILNSLSLYQILLYLVNERDLSLKVTVFWSVTSHFTLRVDKNTFFHLNVCTVGFCKKLVPIDQTLQCHTPIEESWFSPL